jgi:hypothetical protein
MNGPCNGTCQTTTLGCNCGLLASRYNPVTHYYQTYVVGGDSRMTEDDYKRDLERLRTENEFQREPDTGSAFRTVMFVISCTALALFVYFGFVAH